MNNDGMTLREKLRNSCSKIREVTIKCVEGVFKMVAAPIKYIDQWLVAIGTRYKNPSEAEPEAQAQELREAAIDVANAAGHFLADGVAAGISIATANSHSRPAKVVAHHATLNFLLTTTAAAVYEKWGWTSPPVFTLPPLMRGVLIALFVTGLLLLVAKKGHVFFEASQTLGKALKRLFRATIAIGGWYSIDEPESESESEKELLLLTYMVPA